MSDTLTREDQLRAELGLSLDTPTKRDEYMDRLVDKWGSAGWLDAEMAKGDQAKKFVERMHFPEIKGPSAERRTHHVRSIAMVLENQLRYQRQTEQKLYLQSDATGRQYVSLTADTTTADEALPTRQVMPIIRRIYAVIIQNRLSVVQPMAGPTSYVFWLDFLRESDSSNLLSLEYNSLLTPELGVPPKGKLKLTQRQITAIKQMLGVSWSTEAEEDARALLNLDIETELMRAFMEEFARDLLQRHIQDVYIAILNAQASIGFNLPGVWAQALPVVQLPNKGGSQTDTDYKQAIYASLVDADTAFLRANRRPATDILAGYGMAGFLQKINTATGSTAPDPGAMASIGIADYGSYAARWNIQGTEFLADNMAILYTGNPDQLHAGHVYAPYVPVQASPKIYADYDSTTGNFQNKDAWTRTLRERSASMVTRPYSFQLVQGPSSGFAQW